MEFSGHPAKVMVHINIVNTSKQPCTVWDETIIQYNCKPFSTVKHIVTKMLDTVRHKLIDTETDFILTPRRDCVGYTRGVGGGCTLQMLMDNIEYTPLTAGTPLQLYILCGDYRRVCTAENNIATYIAKYKEQKDGQAPLL